MAPPSASPAMRKMYRERYKARHPGRLAKHARNWNLVRKYGLTSEQWDALFESQGRACKICRRTDPGGRYWHTDHAPGPIVRGILCLHCNHSIGAGARKDAVRLRRQVAYVEKFL